MTKAPVDHQSSHDEHCSCGHSVMAVAVFRRGSSTPEEQIDHEADSQKERGQQEQLALHGNQVAVAHVGQQDRCRCPVTQTGFR